MTESTPHIVHQLHLRLEVDTNAEGDYAGLLEKLSSLGNEVVPSVIDKVLSAQVDADEYLQLGRLQVEVEVDDLDELSEVLRLELPRQIRRSLHQLQYSEKQEHRGATLASASGPGQWLYVFLQTGVLPAAAPQKLSLVQLAELSEAWLATQPEGQLQLYKLLRQYPPALQRLIQHLGARWLWQFVQMLERTQAATAHFANWQRVNQYTKIEQEGSAAVLSFWQKELAAIAPVASALPRREELATHSTPNVAEYQLEPNSDTAAGQYYIEDAGLVLLHPFLHNLLASLKLVEDRVVSDPAQAAAVLYALAWGASPQAEWQLVLPKLLLGVPLEQFVEVRQVTPEQLRAGEELITAAITHWAVLGNTSIAGFRESFLQRPGRLDQSTEGWLLNLEQRPYDMLLDHLPWQVSFVRLPWMDYLIRTAL